MTYGNFRTNSNLYQNGVHLLLAGSPLPNPKSLAWKVQTRARAAAALQVLKQGEQGLLNFNHWHQVLQARWIKRLRWLIN